MPHKKFSLVPDFQSETFTIDGLEQLTQTLKRYRVQELKFTSSHRLSLISVDQQTLENISHELQQLSTPNTKSWLTSIQSCPGKESCKYGMRDGEALGRRIEALKFNLPFPAKIKIGIAGCRMCCTEPYVRDIGLIAENSGWKLTFGGNAGGRPRIGNILAEGLTDDQAVELLHKCLTVYLEKATIKMRTARFIEAYGIEEFLRAVRASPL